MRRFKERQRRSRNFSYDDQWGDIVSSYEEDDVSQGILEWALPLLPEGMEELPPRQREALEWRYFSGGDKPAPWKEVGECMGISETAAKNLGAEGRKTLRTWFNTSVNLDLGQFSLFGEGIAWLEV